MAALTAVAFLLRHDHGVYIAVMMVCFLGLREWGGALLWRRLGLYAGVTTGLLLPFLVFVQMTTGLVSYVVESGPQADTIASSPLSLLQNPVPFDYDPSAPLLVIDPPIGPVNVRWVEGADDAARRELEERYGLTAGVRREGRTWSYVLTDPEPGNVRALVEDRLIEDTAGIDRGTFQVLPERWGSWLTRRLFVLRLRSLGPGCVHRTERAGLVLLPDAVGTGRRARLDRRRLVVGTGAAIVTRPSSLQRPSSAASSRTRSSGMTPARDWPTWLRPRSCLRRGSRAGVPTRAGRLSVRDSNARRWSACRWSHSGACGRSADPALRGDSPHGWGEPVFSTDQPVCGSSSAS